MKQFLGTFVALLLVLTTSAQFTIQGRITHEQTNEPIEAATVTLQDLGTSYSTTTTSGNNGNYVFTGLKKTGTYQILVEHVSMQKKTVAVEVINAVTVLNVSLVNNAYFLEPLEVKSLRAADKAPFAKTNLSKAELSKNNQGQDLPFLLNQTPSVVINSDAGNGIGYTGIRIRGSDATRINVTLNGIPYNDAESQGSFFVDMPDIASSVNSIQIQRGVGTSSNGAGAFGASLNLSTNEFNEKAYGEINNSYGSFNSWKNTVKAGSGLIDGHFTVDARLSRVSSDGYIDRASTDLKSLYLSTAYITKKSSVRFNFISGLEKTYQAWNGVPESMLKTNRTYNSSGTEKPGDPYDNETDNYQQDHYQLFFNHSFNDYLSFNTGLFLIKGNGYYEQYKAQRSFSDFGLTAPVINGAPVSKTDAVRQLWLDNDYYGQIFSFQYKKNKNTVTLGGGWNRYEGNHFGEVIWAQTSIPKNWRYYNLDALKTDENVYAKWQSAISNRFDIYADLQYRKVNYTMNGFRDNPTVFVKRKFDFVNPKAGITYSHNGWQSFLSYALANKEPNRDDFEAGVINQPKHETLHDFEAGVEKRIADFSIGATGYYMLYKNQLILTGQINDVGAYTRVNVPNSYRLGIELQAKAKIADWVNIGANASLSRNKINSSQEYIDDYDNGGQVLINHRNTDISFSPSVVAAYTINFIPIKNGEISLLGKYVGRQYLDNTQDVNRSLNRYFVQDARVTYTIKNKLFKEWNIIASVYNAFNNLYEPNGYTFSYINGSKTNTENYYFPMAGTNFMAGINIRL
jgi:iron complex outermembrane receptor protein